MQAGSIFLKNWGRAGRAVGGGGDRLTSPPQKKKPLKKQRQTISSIFKTLIRDLILLDARKSGGEDFF